MDGRTEMVYQYRALRAGACWGVIKKETLLDRMLLVSIVQDHETEKGVSERIVSLQQI